MTGTAPLLRLSVLKSLFHVGSEWHVVNDYVNAGLAHNDGYPLTSREGERHPAYGPGRVRVVERTTAGRVYFQDGSYFDWPKAAQVQGDTDVVRLFGGGAAQAPEDLFLTLTRQVPGTFAFQEQETARLAARTPEQLLAAGEDPRGAGRLVSSKYPHLATPTCTCGERLFTGAADRTTMQRLVDEHLAAAHSTALAAYDVLQQIAAAQAQPHGHEYPDVTDADVREHLRIVHGDEDWETDTDPMGLHSMIHTSWDFIDGHVHPSFPAAEKTSREDDDVVVQEVLDEQLAATLPEPTDFLVLGPEPLPAPRAFVGSVPAGFTPGNGW